MLEKTIKRITPINIELMDEAQKRLNNLTKPVGSLGRLEELAKKVVGICGNISPNLRNKVIFTLAGDHGVASCGVSAYPKEVTQQMVYNFIMGGAAINVLSRHIGARVVVADFGVARDLEIPGLVIKKINYGTKNIAEGPAMTRDEAIRSIEEGISLLEDELPIDIIGTGDMGIANTTPSSAISACMTGKPVEDVTGRGTGIDDKMWEKKVEIIKRALEINKPNPKDPIDVLSKVGGFEIGGLVGIILAGASYKIPVVLDGFISGASALIAEGLEPKVKDYLFASHCSVEIGHKIILEKMGLYPLLDLNMRLGEGTGACLGISLIEAGCKILNEMATFSSAGVSEAIK